MEKAIIVFVAVGILLFAGASALESAEDEAVTAGGDETRILNESLVVDAGTAQTLNEGGVNTRSYSRESNVEVVDSDGNVVPQDEYNFDSEGGNLTVFAGGEVSDGETVEVDYSFKTPTQGQNATTTVASLPIRTGESWLMFFAAFVVFAALLVAAGRS